MKIYTGQGDNGQSGLFSGERVSKAHPLLRAYGTLDECNSQLGVALAATPAADVRDALVALQPLLFDAGADLATLGSKRQIRRIAPEDITEIERNIDAVTARLPQLRSLILPGGTPAAAALHVARTVCRRAERELVAAAETSQINPHVLVLINRLSDYLFCLARLENFLAGIEETPWVPAKTKTKD